AVDHAVTIGVDAVEADAEQAIARGRRHRRLAVVIGLLAVEPLALRGREVLGGQPYRDLGLALLYVVQAPLPVLVEADRVGIVARSGLGGNGRRGPRQRGDRNRKNGGGKKGGFHRGGS